MNLILLPPLTGYKLPAACLALAFVVGSLLYNRWQYGVWL